jgi:hypothetical protein
LKLKPMRVFFSIQKPKIHKTKATELMDPDFRQMEKKKYKTSKPEHKGLTFRKKKHTSSQ